MRARSPGETCARNPPSNDETIEGRTSLMNFSVTRRNAWIAVRRRVGRRLPRRKRHCEQEHAHCRATRRCGKHVRRAARVPVGRRLPGGRGDQHRVPADRLGWRDPGDHEPDGRFRCVGCAAVGGSAHGLQGLPADSVGARRYSRHGELKTNAKVPLHITGPLLAQIYLGQITNWNSPADRRAQQGHHSAGPEDHARLSVRRLGYLVQLHRLPVGGQPRLQGKVGVSTQPPFPVGVGGKGSSGVAGIVKNTSVRSATPTSPTPSRTTSP